MEPQTDWIRGKRPVLEAMRGGRPILRVWISPRAGSSRSEVESQCKELGVDFRLAPDAKLASLCGQADHGGVVAQTSSIPMATLDDLLETPVESRTVVFALDGVENPRNLGLICRSLVAAGCHTLILPAKGGALPGQAFLEASAGYGSRMRFVRVPKLVPALELLKKDGYWVYGLAADASRSLLGHELAERTVFVLGSESDGMRPTVRSALDQSLSIPMSPEVESLNVAVTASLCAFEAVRAGRVPGLSNPAPTAPRNAGSSNQHGSAPPPPRR
ncbi:MAG TPA: RNA methyltransferase [Fibrobacteria bacterium]|nr:RNA methyltransferase [Fibrobacteria bacterium]HOX52013.1 RNA methyltransferase [Fibrobacteria bacterium]